MGNVHNTNEISSEANKIAAQGERGRPEDLQQVHKELQQDMKNYSAQDYGKLLKGIEQQNNSDMSANNHIPKLELYDSGKSGLPDSVKPNYDSASGATGTPMDLNPATPSASSAGGTSHGYGDTGAGAGANGPAGGGSPASDTPPPSPSSPPAGGSPPKGGG